MVRGWVPVSYEVGPGAYGAVPVSYGTGPAAVRVSRGPVPRQWGGPVARAARVAQAAPVSTSAAAIPETRVAP